VELSPASPALTQPGPDVTRSWLDFQASWELVDSWSQPPVEETAAAPSTEAPAEPDRDEASPVEEEPSGGSSPRASH
jgi:hypothetical protein